MPTAQADGGHDLARDLPRPMNPTKTDPYEILSHESNGERVRWEGQMSDGVAATSGEPLAFLSATPNELLLCGNRGSFRVPRAAIRRIGRGRFYPWVFRAIRVEHSAAKYPPELQFKPVGTAPSEVLARLKQMGYPVG